MLIKNFKIEINNLNLLLSDEHSIYISVHNFKAIYSKDVMALYKQVVKMANATNGISLVYKYHSKKMILELSDAYDRDCLEYSAKYNAITDYLKSIEKMEVIDAESDEYKQVVKLSHGIDELFYINKPMHEMQCIVNNLNRILNNILCTDNDYDERKFYL